MDKENVGKMFVLMNLAAVELVVRSGHILGIAQMQSWLSLQIGPGVCERGIKDENIVFVLSNWKDSSADGDDQNLSCWFWVFHLAFW